MEGIGATTRNTRGVYIRSSSNKPNLLFRHVGREKKIDGREDSERPSAFDALFIILCARAERGLGVEGMMYDDVTLVRWSWPSKRVGRGVVGPGTGHGYQAICTL